MLDTKKELEALKALTAGLLTIHTAALGVLEQLRRNQNKCIRCGEPLQEDEEEYCFACYNKWMTQVMDERKHPDER